ncbi:HAD family hydrolase [Cohnella suwonensis]|uniref:HAD family hydrolase n=1 Tax=Cohnella suwonensis TaxID=696072 RepID=A0ABW0LYQ6_9BACL
MININPKTAIFFDLDDTLFCEHDYVRSGFHAVADYLQKIDNQLDSSTLYEYMLEDWVKNGRGKIFNHLIEEFSVPVEPMNLVQVYREHTPQLSLYSDTDRVVKLLVEKDIPRGLITDGEKGVQWRKIEALGLKQRFPYIIVTDELGKDCWKPSAVPFERAKDLLRGEVQSFIYIGDNPHKDFFTAKKMGFHTIRIIRKTGDHMLTRLSPEYEADEMIESLDELTVNLD